MNLRIDFGRGQEALYRDQLSALLRALAEQTRVASVTASNAIEGVTVTPDRAEKIIEAAEPPRFRNRNEREFAGYSDAIDEIMRSDALEPLTVPFILHLHRQLLRHVDGRGGYLKTTTWSCVTRTAGRSSSTRHLLGRRPST